MRKRKIVYSATIPNRGLRRWVRALFRRFPGMKVTSPLESELLTFEYPIAYDSAKQTRYLAHCLLYLDFLTGLDEYATKPLTVTIAPHRMKPWSVSFAPSAFGDGTKRSNARYVRVMSKTVMHIGNHGQLQTESEALQAIWDA